MGAAQTATTSWELRGERRGGWIAFDPAPAERGRQSAGTVHHVAWGTTDAEHPRVDRARPKAGIPNCGFVDRHYFHSLYFREPGGVLYELATEEPGFTVDGPLEELGTKIILPPFLERRREQIEARLTPLPDPRAGWATSGVENADCQGRRFGGGDCGDGGAPGVAEARPGRRNGCHETIGFVVVSYRKTLCITAVSFQ